MQIILLQASNNNALLPIFWVLALGVMYFFFMRPAQKKQKEQATFQEELAKGKEIVTSSGIIGRISKIEDEIVTLQVDQKTFIRITRNAISKEMTDAVLNKSTAEA